MITIYTPRQTPRLEYTLKVVFSEVLGISYRLLTDYNTFMSAGGIRIAYSDRNTGDALAIWPAGLLEEDGIREQSYRSSLWHDLPVIFANDNPLVPFDLFSAVFFLVSRYEEYLPFEPDQHGRFPAEQSAAYRGNFLRMPVVDLWCQRIAIMLGMEKLCRNIQPLHYSFQLTVDIDQPWLYRKKGLFYSAGALIRDVVRLNFREFSSRLMTLFLMQRDPGDTYQYLSDIQERIDKPVKYFILCRGGREYDKNRSTGRLSFRRLIQRLDRSGQVGIHPSFASASDRRLLDREFSLLSAILGRPVTASRQHYLKFRFPETFRTLAERGIRQEYSLGYSHLTGFRAGIARSYNFFDLVSSVEVRLRLVPLHMMDRTLKDSMHLSPEEAVHECNYLTEQVRRVGGEFTCLWHNDATGDRGEWKGWREVFENLIRINE